MKQKKDFLFKCLMAGCAIILPAATMYGQQYDTTKVSLLDEVVITATRNEKYLNNVGRSITVITRDDIKKSGALTISELLNQEEGFYIVGAQQNPGSINSISTRGTNNSHTIVMIDGIPLSDPSSTDNSLDLSELSLANIDRIEIVRGSHSTLYGSSAIGGVINIITTENYDIPGLHVDAKINGGIFGKSGSILSENLLVNYTHKSGFYVTAETFNSNSGGINSTIDTITDPGVYKYPDMTDGFKKTDLVAKTGYKSDNVEVYGGIRNVNQSLDIDDGAFKDDENYTVDFNRNLYTYGAKYWFGKGLSVRFNGGMSHLIRKAVDDSSMISSSGNTDKSYFRGRYSGSIANHEIQLNYNARGFQAVIGGGSFKETMSAETYYYSEAWGVYILESNLDSLKIKTTTFTGFIHADLNGLMFNESLKPFSLGLGARVINHSTFGTTFTYEINPSVKINKNSILYFSYSSGFNAPSLYQLYSPEMDYMSGITRGNKTLDPEESSSWEIGIKQKVSNNIRWSINYYITTIKNCIDYIYLWNNSQEISALSYLDYLGDTYINLGKQTNRGLEFSIHSKISDKLSIAGNFSLVNGKLEYSPDNIDNAHTDGNHIQLYSNGIFISEETERIGLVRRPNTGNINLTYLPFENFMFMVDLKYVGTRNDVCYDSSLGPYGALGTVGLEDYTLLYLRAKYNIFKGFTIMLHAENLLNTDYYEIRGYSTRGRGFYASIGYSF
jgi:vitamin B12 transporter